MHGDHDIHGQPLELVFPRVGRNEEEIRSYITKAVGLLTEIKGEPLQLVAQSIVSYDRDLLYVRNTQTVDDNAIPFTLAVDQIINLKENNRVLSLLGERVTTIFSEGEYTG